MNISDLINHEPRNLTLNDLVEVIDDLPDQDETAHRRKRRRGAAKFAENFGIRPAPEPIVVSETLNPAIRQLFEGSVSFSDFLVRHHASFSDHKEMFKKICSFQEIRGLEKIDLRFYPPLSEHTKKGKRNVSSVLIDNLTENGESKIELRVDQGTLRLLAKAFTSVGPKQETRCKMLAGKVQAIWCQENISSQLKRAVHDHFPDAKFNYLH